MADPNKVFTQQESEELLSNLWKIFSVVRILKEKEIGGNAPIENSETKCRCFEFWGKKVQCENCISMKTLKDHEDRFKIEYVDDKPYQVLSKYLNIENENCVIEILKEITNFSIDPEDVRTLSTRLLHINDKLYSDPMTHAYSRAYYEERKDKRVMDAAVIFLDIDNFKHVNDTYGHQYGDIALKELAQILISHVRSDDTVIRYGGDEFVLVLPNIHKETLVAKLEALRNSVESHEFKEHPEFHLTVSMGAVIVKNEFLSVAVNQADQLLFEAKKDKNKVVIQ